MTRTVELPSDPLSRFREVYDALNAERGWWSDASPLRFAAVAAIRCPGEPAAVAVGIRQMVEEIKQESGWFGPLSPHLRFVVAAMLLANGDLARDLLDEIKRVRRLFRDVGLRRGDVYETIAILVLRLGADCTPIQETTVQRFREIYEEMKRHQWWLTGPEDFPACAMLTGEADSVKEIGETIEAIYQALRGRGFASGDPLQTAANILYLAGLKPDDAATRYRALAEGLRANAVSIWRTEYVELAILSFLDHSPETVVDCVLRHREANQSLRPKPDRSLTLSLAASTTFLELIRLDRDLKLVTDVKALLDMQAVINSHQAAAATYAAGMSAAMTAAAASSAASSG